MLDSQLLVLYFCSLYKSVVDLASQTDEICILFFFLLYVESVDLKFSSVQTTEVSLGVGLSLWAGQHLIRNHTLKPVATYIPMRL